MYISFKKYLYWGMDESHPFSTPSPALPKLSFVWQMTVGMSLSGVVVVGVDQSSMSHLSCTCKTEVLYTEVNKLYLLQKLVQTSPDQSLVGPGFFKMAVDQDQRPDCSCGLLWSLEFPVFSVLVQSGHGLFPVL